MSHILKVKQSLRPLDAMQYLGTLESGGKISDWVQEIEVEGWEVRQTRSNGRNSLGIETLTCRVSAQPLDWIVRHGNGIFKSYPPHEFGSIFEFVEEAE